MTASVEPETKEPRMELTFSWSMKRGGDCGE